MGQGKADYVLYNKTSQMKWVSECWCYTFIYNGQVMEIQLRCNAKKELRWYEIYQINSETKSCWPLALQHSGWENNLEKDK